MDSTASIEHRLVRLLAVIGVVAVLGMLAILPYRLYERDIRNASVQAHRLSSVVHTVLSRTLLEGEDPSDIVNRLQGIADLEIRLTRLKDPQLHPAAKTRAAASTLDGTDLDYVAPPIVDRDGTTWLAQMHFDLSPMKADSVRLIIDLVAVVVLGSVAFSAGVFFLIRRSLVVPLRDLTRAIDGIEPGAGPVGMPDSHTSEVMDLAQAVEKACRARGGGPPARDGEGI